MLNGGTLYRIAILLREALPSSILCQLQIQAHFVPYNLNDVLKPQCVLPILLGKEFKRISFSIPVNAGCSTKHILIRRFSTALQLKQKNTNNQQHNKQND